MSWRPRADPECRSDLRVHVDETHLHRAQRILELAITAVSFVVQPDVLGTPIDVLIALEDVSRPPAKP